MRPQMIRLSQTLALVCAGVLVAAVFAVAQTQNNGPIMRFTATSENVSGAPDQIRIDLLRWSTEAERDQFFTAWTSPTAPAPAAAAGRGGAGGGAGGGAAAGGGRGGGRGGARGGAPTDDAAAGARGAAAPDANAADAAAGGRGARGAAGARGDAPAAAAPDAAGGRGGDAAANAAGGRGGAAAGGGGRGGRGGGGRGGRGGDAAPAVEAAPPTPEGSFLAALQKANTVGYLWTSEAAGYSLRFAYRLPQPDGTERIILATDRRLGSWNGQWKPNGNATPNDYQFTVIELHVNAKGDGEGKASLAGKVTPDANTKAIVLDGYATMPVVLKAVKRTQ